MLIAAVVDTVAFRWQHPVVAIGGGEKTDWADPPLMFALVVVWPVRDYTSELRTGLLLAERFT